MICSEWSWRYVIFGSVTLDTAAMQDEKTGGEEESEKGVEKEAQQESALSHLQPSVLIIRSTRLWHSLCNALFCSWQVAPRRSLSVYQGWCHYHFKMFLIVVGHYILFVATTKFQMNFTQWCSFEQNKWNSIHLHCIGGNNALTSESYTVYDMSGSACRSSNGWFYDTTKGVFDHLSIFPKRLVNNY